MEGKKSYIQYWNAAWTESKFEKKQAILVFLFTKWHSHSVLQLITHLILLKLHSKQKPDESNRRASFQKRHVGFLINVTTYSYEVFAGIKLAGELSVDLS